MLLNDDHKEIVASFSKTVKESVWIEVNFSGSKSKGDSIQVTWDNPEELEAYVKKLQNAANRLMIENARLKKLHSTIGQKVSCSICFSKKYNTWLFLDQDLPFQ